MLFPNVTHDLTFFLYQLWCQCKIEKPLAQIHVRGNCKYMLAQYIHILTSGPSLYVNIKAHYVTMKTRQLFSAIFLPYLFYYFTIKKCHFHAFKYYTLGL